MKLYFAALLFCATLLAQSKWPIESITVEGLKNYTQAQVVAASGLKIGQLAGKEEFEAARDRLLASGSFETVGYRFAPTANSKGYAASFQVIEVDPLYPVRFEGIDRPAAEIEAYLRRRDPFFGSKIPATEAVIKRHAGAINELLGGSPEIAGKVTADGANRLAVVFGPASGPPRVAEVRFVGNSVLPAQALLNNFAGVAYGTVYSETAFRRLLDAGIRPLYEKRGRIKVAFPSIKVENAKDVEGLVVTVTVDEGASYDLGEVRVLGETPVPAKELLRAGGFKPGDLADFERIDAGMEALRKRLRREGFVKAALKVDRRINDEKKTVDLEVTPDLGDRYTFSTLSIRGLDIHGEAAVRKMWGMKEGAPFNGEYPDYFLSQIREQGLFDALGETRSETAIDEKNKTAAVTLVFRPTSIAPGAGSRATSGRPFP